ncbi:Rac GTPase-activating protein [Dirofilaria immitis]
MDKIVCSGRSREILKDYSESSRFAIALIEGHNRIDMLKVLDLLEQMRQNWNYEKTRAEAVEEELEQRNKEKDGLRKEILLYREQLRDARSQIAVLISEKKSMQHDIMEWERKFELVSDLLKDQSHLSIEDRERLFASGSILNKRAITRRGSHAYQSFSRNSSEGENIGYDKTADIFDISSDEIDESRLRNGKIYRRSRSMVSLTRKRVSAVINKRPKKSIMIDTVEEEVETPCKRSKDDVEAEIITISKINTEKKKLPEIVIKSSMNHSLSSNEIAKSEETMVLPTNMLKPRYKTSSVDLTTPISDKKTWTHGASISTRQHAYTNHSSILGDHCEVCNGWIGIVGKQAYKCCDCGLHIHKACINNAPVPCVPRTPTSRTSSKQRPRLKDLCPSTQPMIPSILIHCILALEKNRLCSEGIYRIPGDDIQVQKLLAEFQNGRSVPKLDYHDTETITSCIKHFLIKLRDPIIPSTSWEEFVNAAEMGDTKTLNHSIMDLPCPNRDTLAFLCAHFQKICNNCIQNKMPPKVLARCVAAVIVGSAPSHVTTTDEEAKQVMVMLALLRMPLDYWPKFYNFGNGITLINSPKCTSNDNNKPVRTPHKNPNKSILGPVETPPSGQKINIYQPKISKRKHLLGDIF